MNRKTVASFAVGLLVGIGGLVAATYLSNILNGTMTVGNSLVLSGIFPDIYETGTNQISTFTVQNTENVSLSVRLQLTLSKSGIAPTDASVTIIGNPTVPTCDSTSCVYLGDAFTVLSGDSVRADIGIIFNASGQYAWQLQAIA